MEKSIEGTRDLYTHIQREYTFNGSLDKGIEIKIYRDFQPVTSNPAEMNRLFIAY